MQEAWNSQPQLVLGTAPPPLIEVDGSDCKSVIEQQ